MGSSHSRQRPDDAAVSAPTGVRREPLRSRPRSTLGRMATFRRKRSRESTPAAARGEQKRPRPSATAPKEEAAASTQTSVSSQASSSLLANSSIATPDTGPSTSPPTPPTTDDNLSPLAGLFGTGESAPNPPSRPASIRGPSHPRIPSSSPAPLTRSTSLPLQLPRGDVPALGSAAIDTGSLAAMQSELEGLRSEVEETARQLTEARDRNRRIPNGAVLVIQGLAQTNPEPRGSREPSLDAQARVIGGLLSAAAAATANTLLSPDTITQNRQSAFDAILNRLRPNRNRESSVESALGSYLRDVLRDSTGTSPATLPPVSEEFTSFLDVLQNDLVTAVRAFGANRPGSIISETSSTEAGISTSVNLEDDTASQRSVPVTTHTVGSSPALVVLSAPTSAGPPQGPTTAVPPYASSSLRAAPVTTSLAAQATPTDVMTNLDGTQRLNFFRAHLFPPLPPDTPESVIPSIFIGVRSISHDPSMTTDQLVQHPAFPFVDGQVPDPDPETPTPRRTLRERVIERFGRRQQPRLNTYLVWVIGGWWPRNHPVLAIPGLLTGGPLTDEELSLLSELLGQVKPPTATKEDLEKAELEIWPAAKLQELVDEGKVLTSCLDRCLVCLGDYEPEEEVRRLNCRHAFHKPCVDRWITDGRNSCPVCRTEAVQVKPSSENGESTPVSAGARPDPDDPLLDRLD